MQVYSYMNRPVVFVSENRDGRVTVQFNETRLVVGKGEKHKLLALKTLDEFEHARQKACTSNPEVAADWDQGKMLLVKSGTIRRVFLMLPDVDFSFSSGMSPVAGLEQAHPGYPWGSLKLVSRSELVQNQTVFECFAKNWVEWWASAQQNWVPQPAPPLAPAAACPSTGKARVRLPPFEILLPPRTDLAAAIARHPQFTRLVGAAPIITIIGPEAPTVGVEVDIFVHEKVKVKHLQAEATLASAAAATTVVAAGAALEASTAPVDLAAQLAIVFEGQRKSIEQTKRLEETVRSQAETNRRLGETVRRLDETVRSQAETNRSQAETNRSQAETNRRLQLAIEQEQLSGRRLLQEVQHQGRETVQVDQILSRKILHHQRLSSEHKIKTTETHGLIELECFITTRSFVEAVLKLAQDTAVTDFIPITHLEAWKNVNLYLAQKQSNNPHPAHPGLYPGFQKYVRGTSDHGLPGLLHWVVKKTAEMKQPIEGTARED